MLTCNPYTCNLTCSTEALRDTSDSVLYTLGQLAREFPEITDSLNKVRACTV
jgi:hypothetical protein